MEDTCSDDALWIVASVCEYVKETGELGFFDQVVPFADGGEATVYEHLKRSLDFSAEQIGANGICKGLRADWNDCLNLGGGESAMVSFLHHWALRDFVEAAPLWAGRRTWKNIRPWPSGSGPLRRNLWDGEWYIRGFTKRGSKIGSHENEEGKIFLEARAGRFSRASRRRSGRSVHGCGRRHLYSPYGIHLLWPAFIKPDDDIGYVTRVYKGIKENAAIFSHPNPWAIVAECKLGRGERAMKFYDALLPYNQNDMIEIRQAEPYSYCQFIMGRDHTAHGRARHPWLTGTAGWAYTAATRTSWACGRL